MRDVHEVDDVSARDAIQDVSGGARRDEEQGGAPEPGAIPPEQQSAEQARHRDRAQHAQQRHARAFRHGAEKIEGDVGVLGIPQVQNAVNQVMGVLAFQLALRDLLRGVITADEKRQPEDQQKALGDWSHGGRTVSASGPFPRDLHRHRPSGYLGIEMPAYAFANGPMTCPACGATLDDKLWFQWGFCIDRAQRPEAQYAVGDEIRWRACADGRVPAWTYFHRGDEYLGGNLGSREERHVIVRDQAQLQHYGPCSACGTSLDGGAVEIRDNRIVRAWILRSGELPVTGSVSVLRVRPDGATETLVDDDHRMDLVYDC